MTRTRGAWSRIAFVAAGASALLVLAAAPADGRGTAGDTLSLHADLRITGGLGACPEGTASTIECIPRRGQGSASGLGELSESYLYLLESVPEGACPAGATYFRVGSYPVQLVVVGKGAIDLLVQGSPDCLLDAGPANLAFLQPTQRFTVAGGSGRYAGASGDGTVSRRVSQTAAVGHAGVETWEGTLVVPGFEFDVTPPVLNGIGKKTFRAPGGARAARARFTVTAQDDIDGSVPATCSPHPGSRFRIGRTRVTCSARDSSGNTATASFTVVVRRRR
jgi:HYR domain